MACGCLLQLAVCSGVKDSDLPDQFQVHTVATRGFKSLPHDLDSAVKTMIVKWLKDVDENGLREECSIIYGNSGYNESAVMAREVDCGEPGATKDYSFSGRTL